MPSLFDQTYREVTGTENAQVVLFICETDLCDNAVLAHYFDTPRCSTCGEAMERSEES